MAVDTVYADGKYYTMGGHAEGPMPEIFPHEVTEFAILASQQNPFDPMEKALKELGESKLAETDTYIITGRL